MDGSARKVFHPGELAVQERAGVATAAAGVGRGVRTAIPDVARLFLSDQRFAVVAGMDDAGRRWASILSGPAGFLDSPDESTLTIAVRPASDDPIGAGLREGRPLGVLVLDPRTRRRMKVKGDLRAAPEGLRLRVRRVYALCPKYIHRREVVAPEGPAPGPARRSERLTSGQMQRIARADTFFIATYHPDTGADASHRGGLPGFVRVVSERRLLFADYPGNNMFNTLGNLAIDPRAGLLFVDFDTGAALQLTGSARVLWDAGARERLPGSGRVVEMQVEQVVDTDSAVPLRWRLVEISPFTRI